MCGSDTHAAHGRHPFIELPYHPGHEVVGVVVARGTGVDGIEVGQRVTVEPDLPCWECKQCRRGTENLCENLRFFGCGYDQGGMADYFTIPANRVHVIPDDLDYRAAALIEPMSTPVHAVRLAGDVRDQTVVILGAGTIGLLVLAVVRAHGAKRIVVTDPLPDKRARRNSQLGADVALDAAVDDIVAQARAALGESADVVFDCVAVTPTVRQAIEMAEQGRHRRHRRCADRRRERSRWRSSRTTRSASRAAPPTCPRTTPSRSASSSTAKYTSTRSSPPRCHLPRSPTRTPCRAAAST